MSLTMDGLIEALADAGIPHEDMRNVLATGPGEYRQRSPEGIDYVVVHHSSGSTGGRNKVLAIAKYHSGLLGKEHLTKNGNGAPGIAYTLAVDSDGILYACWDLSVRTWSQGSAKHPGDENSDGLAIVFVGNFSGNRRPTNAQLATLETAWPVIRDYLNLSNSDLRGHFDFGKSACPGPTLKTWVKRTRGRMTFETVKQRQSALLRLGYDLGRWGADGDWGEVSRSALVTFERDTGLNPDGVWDVSVDAAVKRVLASR